ncbi:LysR family transcriptional regulator [Klebsiella pneumoniae subsp. pneumoniae]|nr:LysR family transcriptional regulator [Klebsiella pneumoniae subsp. pneumoniae]
MSVTHSAVSQHIKQLEALVGVTLFIRHGRGVRITEEGRLYALQNPRGVTAHRRRHAHGADQTPHPGSDPGDAPLLWLPLAAAAAGALSGAASADRGAPADQPGGG